MKVKATVLCENTVTSIPGALAEHGWAIFLETDQGNFLQDTGQGLAIVNNAKVLKKDLTSLEGIILSHHHNDHTGGLLQVLEAAGPHKVYSHPELFKESILTRNNQLRNIGMPFSQEKLEEKGASFIFNTDYTQLVPGLFLTGEIPRKTSYEKGDKDQVIKVGDEFQQDPLPDDQSVVIETEKGLFVVLGCCHAGIINTLNYILEKTGEKKLHTVIGGTHLGPMGEAEREQSIAALKEFEIEYLGVSHCTGLKTSVRLSQEFKERFFFCNVGTVIEF